MYLACDMSAVPWFSYWDMYLDIVRFDNNS